MTGLDRLLILREQTQKTGLLMEAQRGRFLDLANRKELGNTPRPVIGFNLFQTPRVIAAQMAEKLAGFIGADSRILEPSAGLGRLCEPFDADKLEELRIRWQLVEDVSECCHALTRAVKRAQTKQADFLLETETTLGGKFDAVIMNPPFKQGRDVKHILHALEFVRDGGRLVSLCYNGTKQREQLKPIAAEWIELPANSFRDEGTSADVVMAVFDV